MNFKCVFPFLFILPLFSFSQTEEASSATSKAPEVWGIKIGMNAQEVAEKLKTEGFYEAKEGEKRAKWPPKRFKATKSISAKGEVEKKTGQAGHEKTPAITSRITVLKEDENNANIITTLYISLSEDVATNKGVVNSIRYSKKGFDEKFKKQIIEQLESHLKNKFGNSNMGLNRKWTKGDINISRLATEAGYTVSNDSVRKQLLQTRREYIRDMTESWTEKNAPKVDF